KEGSIREGEVLRVLAVDDDGALLQLLEDSLRVYGFEVIGERDDGAALERVEKMAPDVILLDVMLGGTDGLLICMELKKKAGVSHIPVVFLSGVDDVEEKARCFRVGAVDYIVKPVEFKELAIRLRRQVELARKWQQLEERNRANAVLLREVFEVLEEAVGVCRVSLGKAEDKVDLLVDFANKSFWNFLGVGGGGHDGLRLLESGVLRGKEGMEEKLRKLVKEFVFEGKQRGSFEIFLQEEKRWLRVSLSLGMGGNLLMIITDITIQKKAEEEKRAEVEAVLRGEKIAALGTLMAGMCHEINNPNNVIMMNVPLLERIWEEICPIVDKEIKSIGISKICNMRAEEVLDQFPKLLGGMRRAAMKIRDVVKLVRDFTQSGVERSEMRLVDLNEAIQMSLELVNNRLPGFGGKVVLELEEDLPNVVGDFRRIEQVLVNLLVNAGESLVEEGKKIYVRTRRGDEDGQVELLIEDEGCGIPAEILSKIGTPFVTTKGRRGGMGLGISICQRILQDHQAKMKIESEVGKGTKVRIVFPRCAVSGGGTRIGDG
ncbi:MAG: response regulator, partial [Chthoniobacterales bacterium]|nr:response regulator [Chthoniobacterales bacterium]